MRTSTKKEHAADQRQWTPDDMDFRRPFDDIPIGTANRTQRDFQIFFDSLSAQERAEIRARCAVIGSDQRFIEWARDVLRESGADAGQQGETNFAQPEIWQPQGTAMERVTRKIVRIERPFRLGEENNPAGDYEVTTYEEPLEFVLLGTEIHDRGIPWALLARDRGGELEFAGPRSFGRRHMSERNGSRSSQR
jgi:hypothetical protein